jgi:hypothetical protein
MKKVSGLIFMVFLFMLCGTALAYVDGDNRYWLFGTVCWKPDKTWNFGFTEELYFAQNYRDHYLTCHQISAGYLGLGDWISVDADYRLTYSKSDVSNPFTREDRPRISSTVKWQALSSDMSNRFMLEYRCFETSSPSWRYRNKLQVNLPYKLTVYNIQPYFGDEAYYDMRIGDFNYNEAYAGVSYKLIDGISGAVFGMISFSKSGNAITHAKIIGTSFKYQI